MSAVMIGEASLRLPLLGAKLDEDGIVASPDFAAAIRNCLRQIREEVSLGD